jgi:hypothetical protein
MPRHSARVLDARPVNGDTMHHGRLAIVSNQSGMAVTPRVEGSPVDFVVASAR